MRLKTISALIITCLVFTIIYSSKAFAFVDAAGIAGALGKIKGVKEGKKVSGEYEKNEMMVDKMDGTIMVLSPDDPKPVALQTFSTVEKGDVLTVYDKSWVILKNHKGDRIGIDSGTVVAIDEFFIQGPDRQVRLLLQKGILHLKTNGSGSRQSFFEVNTGNVVTSVNEVQANLNYAGNKNLLSVQFFNGKMTVIDKDNEQKFKTEYVEHNWENGKMAEEEPVPVDELDKVNYNRFFDGEDPLGNPDSNILLAENSKNNPAAFVPGNFQANQSNMVANIIASEILSSNGPTPEATEAKKAYIQGKESFNQGRFQEAKENWEAALTLLPHYKDAMNRLKNLSKSHPELKIDDFEWKQGETVPKTR